MKVADDIACEVEGFQRKCKACRKLRKKYFFLREHARCVSSDRDDRKLKDEK